MIYNITDKPPLKEMLLFALQLMLSVFVATVLIANICQVSVSGALVGAGISTLVYLLCTNFQSPMFVSNSGAFVAPVILSLSIGGLSGVAIGGLVSCLIYILFGLFFKKNTDKVYNYFPKALIGAVTVVIGINLMPFILSYIQIDGITNKWGILISFVTMISIALISHYAKGILKILPFLIGTLIGYALALILTITNIYPIVNLNLFENLTLFQVPDFAFVHWQKIDFITIIPIITTYIAYTISAMMECLSDHAALSNIISTDLYKKPGLQKIFTGMGLANLTGSCIGGLGICSYGEGVACVGFSKVASVWVTGLAAILLSLLGCLAPIQAFIMSIPNCVFAGAAVILYGFIACSGIKMLQKTDLNNQKNLIITSVVLSLGISGIIIGNQTISLSATALALVAGVILNIVLKEKKNGNTTNY